MTENDTKVISEDKEKSSLYSSMNLPKINKKKRVA